MRALVWLLVLGSVAAAAPRKPLKTKIQGATQVFSAPWGLAAQGSGQLRTLPAGKTTWTTVRHVKGDSLYRIAFDDRGRLMAWWEKESEIHLFDQKKDIKIPLPKPPPAPELKYGFGVEEMFFTSDGTGAIVYMHGFTGGRTWATVAYHIAFDKPGEPTLLYRQDGYSMHVARRYAVYATPLNKNDACEHNSCYPLGAITAWEINGTKATKHVLLAPDAKNKFSRVRLIAGADDDQVAIDITEHPSKRHVLRWRAGDAKAAFAPVPDGPVKNDTEHIRLMKNGDLVEIWLTKERGLEIKRAPQKGDAKMVSVPPLPQRTKNDRPLFDIRGSFERPNGDLVFEWGEYLVVVPADGSAVKRLDLRPLFGKQEIESRVIYVRDPESFWIGSRNGRAEDFINMPVADVLERAKTLSL